MMALARHVKGCISMRELEDMPMNFIQTLYKDLADTNASKEKKENKEAELAQDELIEAIGG